MVKCFKVILLLCIFVTIHNNTAQQVPEPNIVTINSKEDIFKESFEYRPFINSDNIKFQSTFYYGYDNIEDVECYCLRAGKKPLLWFGRAIDQTIEPISNWELVDNLNLNEDNMEFVYDVKDGKYASEFGFMQYSAPTVAKNYIIYRKEYEQQAQILAAVTEQANRTLKGILLGYSLKDIQAFYNFHKEEFKWDIQQDIQEDLKLAHEINAPAFIEQQLKELEKMVNKY